VIESQVRGRVAPSLTQKSSTDRDPSIDWMWAVIALSVVGTCVCFTVLICFFVRKLKSTKKRSAIAPINVVSLKSAKKSCPPKPAVQSNISGTGPSGKAETKRLLLRDLLRSSVVSDDQGLGGGRLTPQSEQDDISTIHLVRGGDDSNECSLQGQPRSHGSPTLSSAVSGNSARNSQKSGSKSSSVGDYKQNFPYEPPRDAQEDKLRHSRLRSAVPSFGSYY
jgi:hypothetical protein